MKKLILSALFTTLPTLLIAANIEISAVKKTENQRSSSRQQLPGGSTRIKNSEMFYRFDIKCMDTQVPAEAELQYVVVVEKGNGDLTPGAWGIETIKLTFGQTVSVETDTVDISERTWSRDEGRGKIESKVYGYGARIVDQQGEELARKFSKPSVENYLIDLIEKKDKEEQKLSGEEMRERIQRRRLTRPVERTP